MFLGHFAVGIAAKKVAPRTSLGTLTLAALWLDILWPLSLLLGLERAEVQPNANPFLTLNFTSYPFTHSLLMALVWAVLFAVVYAARTKYRTGALVAGLLVVSHWVLDYLTHLADLPIWPGGPLVGLGLWAHPSVTVLVEGFMFVVAVALYATLTTPKNMIGKAALWAYLVVLAMLYSAFLHSPAPPSVTVVAYTGIVGWIFVPWAFWIDHNREVRSAKV